MMKKVSVFCGSASGKNPDYLKLAVEMGELLASRQIGLVYGGASIGVMGEIANAALKGGSEVIGVIPQSIVDLEVAHGALTKLEVVSSMHERKNRMYELSDALITLPGGFGTLDELCEVLTWAQLGLHSKPVILLNSFGFFNHLLKHFDFCHSEGFVSERHRSLVKVASTPAQALELAFGAM
jgi:hypothetical protein